MNELIKTADHVLLNSNEVQIIKTAARICTINMRTQMTPIRTILPAVTPAAVVRKTTAIVSSATNTNLKKSAKIAEADFG